MGIRLLTSQDDLAGFSCGIESLDRYLQRHALDNAADGVSVTYVEDSGSRVRGFVTLAGTTVTASEFGACALPRYRLPALLVARLAVDSIAQGEGVGWSLMRFAFEEAITVYSRTGCVGVVVDAKPGAAGFYQRLGFSPIEQVATTTNVRMFIEIGTVLDAIE